MREWGQIPVTRFITQFKHFLLEDPRWPSHPKEGAVWLVLNEIAMWSFSPETSPGFYPRLLGVSEASKGEVACGDGGELHRRPKHVYNL